MKFEAVTIKDIAKALGLSTSTVSRALRDSYEISPETKQAVLEYARQINYRPNPIALSLKEKRSRSIGVVVSEIANSFFSQAINGIESIAYTKGYHVIITQSLESYEREVMNMQFLSSRSVDGCLISVSSETNDFTHLSDLYQRGLPIVCFDRVVEDIACHKVSVDNVQGAYDATSHLIRSGFRRIAFVANAEVLSITRERQAGYRKALEDHGLSFDPSIVQYCTHGGMRLEEVETAVQGLLQQPLRPDAVFASSDKLTTNCMRYFRKEKIRVPEDMGVIGFSNLDLTDLLAPPLSVVRQPAYEMGRLAAELLIRVIESKKPETAFEKRVLPAELLVRESSLKGKR
ncbi:LacI family DNA-binding transcriptional regulator [Dinghuibacter silviterrae]|uniref:LacI family transcriptional regulator n=1 Tax=Dinghuibacter silviterrae TaxID=1539049 RepID=A0A4R8DFQ2_9BACT|nr:LacI family DNA-binding transcriptional regulator [Dinghuibacter silviterrae]TDW96429.1 LacI family transcriptional regulator [Dinghuibacter silviterrae]